MQHVTRRDALRSTTLIMAGTFLTANSTVVRADEHEPPGEDEVEVPEDNAIYVEPDPDTGFHYPYFLYTPPSLESNSEHDRPILVQPSVSPSADDAFETHIEGGKTVIQWSSGRTIADEIDVPLLVPVFPRYRNEPEPWYVYVQVLDNSTFELDDSPLERVDLQVWAMVEDATSRLEDEGHAIAPDVQLNGFSASSNFVNRFTFIHPSRVNAVSSGGDGKFMLPKAEIDDDVPAVDDPEWEELPYPVGVANLEDLTGNEFDEDAWLDVPQYLYTGGEDQPEPGDSGYRGFPNLYEEDVQRIPPEDRPYGLPDLIEDIFGVKQVDERFEVSRAVYDNVGATAEFTIYDGYGHTPEPAIEDLIEFHRTHIHEEFGPQFDVTATWSGPEIVETEALTVEVTYHNLGAEPTSTTATLLVDGERVEATDTEVGPDETETVEFEHHFDEPGTYTVEIDEHDISVGQVDVTSDEPPADEADESDGGTDENVTTPTPEQTDEDNDSAQDGDNGGPPGDDGFGPGFGVPGALTSLTGLGYLLKQRVSGPPTDD